jgi:hypothetical protein
MEMKKDPSGGMAKTDKRTLSRMLMRGEITAAELKAGLKTLPDLKAEANFFEVSWEKPDDDLPERETE